MRTSYYSLDDGRFTRRAFRRRRWSGRRWKRIACGGAWCCGGRGRRGGVARRGGAGGGGGGGRGPGAGADEEVADAGVAFGATEVDGEESECVWCEWVGPGGEKSMYDGGYLNAHGDVEE